MVNILSSDKNSGERYRAHGSSCLNPERFAEKLIMKKNQQRTKNIHAKLLRDAKTRAFVIGFLNSLPLVSSDNNLCEQFGPRSGPRECQA